MVIQAGMKKTTMRAELEPLPERMRHLRIDDRGYPVPWFVPWVDGQPEFRAMDAVKRHKAIKDGRCWVCGGSLYGQKKVFVIGPMCGVNRTTAEPPNHLECARWSARNCPFLTQREIKRREDDLTRSCSCPGVEHQAQSRCGARLGLRKFQVVPGGQRRFSDRGWRRCCDGILFARAACD